jgi:hypothetical protein
MLLQQFNPTADIGRSPDEDFEDLAIFSACRRVLVWRWAAGPSVVAVSRGLKRGRRPAAAEEEGGIEWSTH